MWPGLKGSLRKGDKKAATRSTDNHCLEYSGLKKGAGCSTPMVLH